MAIMPTLLIGEKMHTLYIKWGTSRGRDTYGYTTCTLSENGRKITGCNGGGYDMRGTVFGNWLASAYRDRLLKLKAKDMPANSHWEPDYQAFVCRACSVKRLTAWDGVGAPPEPVTAQSEKPLHADGFEWPKCPECGEDMDRDNGAGKRVNDGRHLYGLTFHDPNYDPSKAVIGKDCSDRTLGKGAKGKTVEQAEDAGESFGLERYQAIYSASSKVPTKRHTIPSIDGACGFDSVRKIAEAIGLSVRTLDAGKKMDIIEVADAVPERKSA